MYSPSVTIDKHEVKIWTFKNLESMSAWLSCMMLDFHIWHACFCLLAIADITGENAIAN